MRIRAKNMARDPMYVPKVLLNPWGQPWTEADDPDIWGPDAEEKRHPTYTVPYGPQEPPSPAWDGEKVRRLREHLGLTTTEFGREINKRYDTVEKWEAGGVILRRFFVDLNRLNEDGFIPVEENDAEPE